jgi:hypothetical protein
MLINEKSIAQNAPHDPTAHASASMFKQPDPEKIDPTLLTHTVRMRHEIQVDGIRRNAGDEITVTEKHFGGLSIHMELIECPAGSRYAELAERTVPATPKK